MTTCEKMGNLGDIPQKIGLEMIPPLCYSVPSIQLYYNRDVRAKKLMPTRITLLRHGQTSWNVIGRWQGHGAVPLNEAGRRQAEVVGEYLAEVNFEVDYIYSSDLSRAAETAQIIARHLNMEVLYDQRF